MELPKFPTLEQWKDLINRIKKNASDISSETSNRTDAETALGDRITQEATAS